MSNVKTLKISKGTEIDLLSSGGKASIGFINDVTNVTKRQIYDMIDNERIMFM